LLETNPCHTHPASSIKADYVCKGNLGRNTCPKSLGDRNLHTSVKQPPPIWNNLHKGHRTEQQAKGQEQWPYNIKEPTSTKEIPWHNNKQQHGPRWNLHRRCPMHWQQHHILSATHETQKGPHSNVNGSCHVQTLPSCHAMGPRESIRWGHHEAKHKP
jgi:hypothetical protein